MLIDSDYCGFRIEVNAGLGDGAWNAEARIRRTLSEDQWQSTPRLYVRRLLSSLSL